MAQRIAVTADTFRLAQVFTISRGSRTESKVLTVRITSGEDRGWGECVPYPRYDETPESVAAQIAALPQDITREALQDAMEPGAGRNAVDCALWDLEAKRAGRRVWELAGLGRPGPEITAYTLSLDTPDNMRAAAAKNAHRPLLKIKLGTPDDMARLEAVRAGAPAAAIIVDANEGWDGGRLFRPGAASGVHGREAGGTAAGRRARTTCWPRSPGPCRSVPTNPAMTARPCPR